MARLIIHLATRPICFTLIVDDFGVKYVGDKHAQHLVDVLQEFYVVDKYWDGKKYCGINLDWDYDRRRVHLSMPGYCSDVLIRFCHEAGRFCMDQPHKHAIPAYRAKI